MTNLLFIHQNYPGQYREIMPAIAQTGRANIVFLTQRQELPKPTNHIIVRYKTGHAPAKDAYAYSRMFETNCGHGVGAANACREIAKRGFKPDLVIGHAGWGELLFVKDVWPDVPLLGCFEWYFIPKGGPVGFDPEFPERPDVASLLHARNAVHHLSYLRCDGGHCATQFQRNAFPDLLKPKIEVIHEGIRTDRLVPDHTSDITVARAEPPFRRGQEIVTYIARNLEPARGFHVFMRALPDLLGARPNARIAIIGGDEVSYGGRLPGGKTFRAKMLEELGARLDLTRVHFLGQIPYSDLMALLKISRCHVYLSSPFVVSWSMLEAMALEKSIVASDVACVREVMTDGETGMLVDFFDPKALAARIADVLAHPDGYRSIGRAARAHVVGHYDFQTRCLPPFLTFMNRHLPAGRQIVL